MFHTKGVIIVFILLMGFSVISSCMSAYDSKEMADAIEKQKKDGVQPVEPDASKTAEDVSGSAAYNAGYEFGERMSGSFGVYVDTPVNNDGSLCSYIFIYCEELSSGILLLFILIGAVVFFRGDEKNGFLKNIACQAKHRYNIFFSKLTVIGIYTFICMFSYMLAGFATFKCSWLLDIDIDFGVEYIPDALKIFALQYLLYMAFISGLLLIAEVTRSTATAITIGLLGVMGCGIFFSAIIQKIFHTDFDISKYYINTNISGLNIGAGQNFINLALGIGITFFIIYNAANVFWFSKKDIV